MFSWIKKMFGFETKKQETKIKAPAPQSKKVSVTLPDSGFKNEKESVTRKENVTYSRSKLEGMTKGQLDEFAKERLGLALDRRKSKKFMIEQIQKAQKEK